MLYMMCNPAERSELVDMLLKVLGRWYSERCAMLTGIPLGDAGGRLYKVDAIGAISWEGRVYRDTMTVEREERMEGADDTDTVRNAPDGFVPIPESGGETPHQSSDDEMIHSSAVKKGARKDAPWEESESEGYQPRSDENEDEEDYKDNEDDEKD